MSRNAWTSDNWNQILDTRVKRPRKYDEGRGRKKETANKTDLDNSNDSVSFIEAISFKPICQFAFHVRDTSIYGYKTNIWLLYDKNDAAAIWLLSHVAISAEKPTTHTHKPHEDSHWYIMDNNVDDVQYVDDIQYAV